MKVVGIKQAAGKYEGQDYHNVNLHCTFEDENALGLVTEVVKCKFAKIKEIFGMEMKAEDWQGLIGSDILVNYSKYGAVNGVIIR